MFSFLLSVANCSSRWSNRKDCVTINIHIRESKLVSDRCKGKAQNFNSEEVKRTQGKPKVKKTTRLTRHRKPTPLDALNSLTRMYPNSSRGNSPSHRRVTCISVDPSDTLPRLGCTQPTFPDRYQADQNARIKQRSRLLRPRIGRKSGEHFRMEPVSLSSPLTSPSYSDSDPREQRTLILLLSLSHRFYRIRTSTDLLGSSSQKPYGASQNTSPLPFLEATTAHPKPYPSPSSIPTKSSRSS
ncbi:hypothetical protein PM082_004518 [Marasmius tenuissimus]|nr:hypothetical protein PM082_004518 [Marasmius tenuissimus]